MTNFAHNNNTYCIPTPKYSFGDMLTHTFKFHGGQYILVGEVIGRTYSENEPGTGYWEYEIEANLKLSTGIGAVGWSESLPENQLQRYFQAVAA